MERVPKTSAIGLFPIKLLFSLIAVQQSLINATPRATKLFQLLLLVGEERLELSLPKKQVPKTCVSAIPPLAQNFVV